MEIARQDRDSGLARVRRITVYTGLSAAALTALISLIAASTIPGRASGASASPPSAAGGGENAGSQEPVGQPSSLNPPDQPPQADQGGGSVAVSGGS